MCFVQFAINKVISVTKSQQNNICKFSNSRKYLLTQIKKPQKNEKTEFSFFFVKHKTQLIQQSKSTMSLNPNNKQVPQQSNATTGDFVQQAPVQSGQLLTAPTHTEQRDIAEPQHADEDTHRREPISHSNDESGAAVTVSGQTAEGDHEQHTVPVDQSAAHQREQQSEARQEYLSKHGDTPAQVAESKRSQESQGPVKQ